MRTPLVLALLVVLAPAQQTFLVPSGATPTIQSALDLAVAGDTVQVAAGVYLEHLVMPGGVSLAGAGDGLTILDGSDLDRCVEILAPGNGITRIRDLTIRNGRATGGPGDTGYGGGVFFAASASGSAVVRIESVTIHDCEAMAGGAAVGTDTQSPVAPRTGLELVATTIRDCRVGAATTSVTTRGVAVTASGISVQNCRFLDNQDLGPAGRTAIGGAIFNVGDLVIARSLFQGNTARHGGALYQLQATHTLVEDSLFLDNEATVVGGAIQFGPNFVIANGEILIHHCLFTGNSAGQSVSALLAADAKVELIGCTIAGNGGTAASVADLSGRGSLGLLVRDTIFSDNATDHVELEGTPIVIENSLFADPDNLGLAAILAWPHFFVAELSGLRAGFRDPEAGDYALLPGSPCVDSGFGGPNVPALDLAGQPRVVGATIDIGCFELQDQDPGAAFAGTTTAPDLLSFDGTTGGTRRTVTIDAGTTCTLAMAEPIPGTPAPFILWGYLGVPGPGEAFPIPFAGGSMAFRPHIVGIGDPHLFTMANNLLTPNSGLLASTPAPWSVTGPSVPFPITMTLQGLIAEGSGPLRITNALTLHTR